MTINVPDDDRSLAQPPSPDEQRKLVDMITGHMEQPCETEHGNLRDFYIREAERLIEKGIITDPVERVRLEKTIQLAKNVRDFEQENL